MSSGFVLCRYNKGDQLSNKTISPSEKKINLQINKDIVYTFENNIRSLQLTLLSSDSLPAVLNVNKFLPRSWGLVF